MTYVLGDTIAAIASAPGGAARGIVRVSGNCALQYAAACFNASCGWTPSDHKRAQVLSGTVTLAALHATFPCELYVWPNWRSYTGEPVAEFHTLGSPPLLQALLEEVCNHGARLAQPGEFTLRAFLAGKLDLVQAEAVLGVIDSAGPDQLRAALDQLAGGLSKPLNVLRSDLLDLLADLEAGLDFTEEDIEFITAEQLLARLSAADSIVRSIADQMSSRSLATDLPRIALVGLPNAGKSSLFNALAGNSSAIVSNVPGTTRDYLTAKLDLAGLLCELVDTAGLESVDDLESISAAAQRTAQVQANRAMLRVLCIDSTGEMTATVTEHIDRCAYEVLVHTKCDGARTVPHDPRAIETSCVSGMGLEQLKSSLRQSVEIKLSPGGAVVSTAARCVVSLQNAAQCLSRASQLVRADAGEELISAEIRGALHELGHVVGAVYTDDVLDRIFSRFCIGK